MDQYVVRSIDDVRRIEEGSYDAYMPYHSVYEALSYQAERRGDRPALMYLESAERDGGVRRWTYRALHQEVTRLANFFRQVSGDEEVKVAMLLPATAEAHFVMWAAQTAGQIFPINHLLNPEHVAELIRASGSNIVVALGSNPHLDIWSKVAMVRERCPAVRRIFSVNLDGTGGHDDLLASAAAARSDVLTFTAPSDRTRRAALFHTGGTTGIPKIVQLSHLNVLHSSFGATVMYGMTEDDVTLNGFPLFHVAGSFVFGLSQLLAGGCLVLPTLLGMRNAQFMERYWEVVERLQVTLLTAVPTGIAVLLQASRSGRDLSSVRALLTGGSPVPGELAAEFQRQLGVPVLNGLGMTEAAGAISLMPFHAEFKDHSCGLPLPFTRVRLGPSASGGDVGESAVLHVAGPGITSGYQDPRHDLRDGDWLITGDIARVAENGCIHITGRAKDLIIRNGHNIDPVQIEDALMRHPAVEFVAAVGEPDEYAGELPVAFVAPKQGLELDPAELATYASYISERPAYPKRITVLQSLPLTAIGKVFKPELRKLAVERVFTERLVQLGLSEEVSVQAVNRQGGVVVVYTLTDSALAPKVEALMQRFSIPYEISSA